MSRFSAVLSLAGLALFTVGTVMMLRFMLVPEWVDPSLQENAEALYRVAGRFLFAIYFFAIACGSGMFCAGLAMLLGRLRFR